MFFKAFHTFLGGGDHTEGRQGGNNNPWFRLSYTGKDTFLVGSHAKKEKKTHLQLCTDSIMSQWPAFWSASPVTDMPGLSGCIM